MFFKLLLNCLSPNTFELARLGQQFGICHVPGNESSSRVCTRPSSLCTPSQQHLCSSHPQICEPLWLAGTGRPICPVTQSLIDTDRLAEDGLPSSSEYLIIGASLTSVFRGEVIFVRNKNTVISKHRN